ncbi:MAG: hypothetical protein JJU37_01535 [Balneolaceae bacterium]|nr:hypothetical protein [Balneolaceae bacterium]
MTTPVTIKTVHGKQLEPFLNSLAKLRIRVFREFPYLYDGSIAYEEKYLRTYLNSSNSIAILVFDGEHMVGASTGLPITDETDEFIQPFADADMDPETVFYCGESILLPEYRGLGIYSKFINKREIHAKKLGFSTITFCAVSRRDDHPLMPKDYIPLDEIWKKYGYRKRPDLHTTYRWKDIDEEEESDKKMVFWIKEL